MFYHLPSHLHRFVLIYVFAGDFTAATESPLIARGISTSLSLSRSRGFGGAPVRKASTHTHTHTHTHTGEKS